MSRTKSIIVSMIIYLVVIAIVVYSIRFFQEYPILVRIAIADLIATVLIFLSSMAFNNSSMYDPYWSVKPLVIAIYYYSMLPEGQASMLQMFTLLLVGLYALRLTSNFYRDWPGMDHEDWRYRNFRKQFPKAYWIVSFFGIHLFPTIMVYLGCLPMYVIYGQATTLPVIAWLGVIILAGSVLLAYAADEQLRKFRRDPENAGITIRVGLWSVSRHPNYLGEILTWWGLFVVALGAGMQYWWSGVGALVITLMFVFISIPLIEKYAKSRRKDYEEYVRSTSMILPIKKT